MKKHPGFLLPSNFSPQMGYIQSEGSEYGSLKTKADLPGSSPSRIKGYPQDEQHRRGREREKEREKEREREREKERKTRDWGCPAESGNALFFIVALIP